MEPYSEIPRTPQANSAEMTPIRRTMSIHKSPFSALHSVESTPASKSSPQEESGEYLNYSTAAYDNEDDQILPFSQSPIPERAETPPYGKTTSALIEDKQNLAWNEKYQLLLDSLPTDFIDSPERVRL
jgi:hypothetical protein